MRCFSAFILGCLLLAAGSAAAQDLTAERDSAHGAIQQLRQAMMQALQTSMREAGPAEATAVCRHLAPEMAAEISAETGWQIRRPALKARNPANRPTEEERGVLLGYLTRSLAGQSFEDMETLRLVEQDGKTYVHYMRAIPMLDACLTCHGSNLAPDVAAKIAEVYPEDEAVGFRAGELRGAFSLLRPYDPEAAPAVRAPRLPEVPAAGPIAFEASGLRGDPVAGRGLFGAHCLSCHGATDLATHLYPGGGEGTHGDVCEFLQTHGLTDRQNDCDIIAYLKVLARQVPE
ncbi:DUF3365 domain-containing protein [Pelagibius sp. CAU 1746]|uniref:Tll0287-like domain-containing protein n=1 Tax=Pelagibius sp. CAU 1746 TaxID=3140370 RepID=UPI00325BF5DA